MADYAQTVQVPAGGTVTVSQALQTLAAGTFQVSVPQAPGLGSVSFTVTATPANITLSNLRVSPTTVTVGQTVTLMVDAHNSGGTAGSITITFRVA